MVELMPGECNVLNLTSSTTKDTYNFITRHGCKQVHMFIISAHGSRDRRKNSKSFSDSLATKAWLKILKYKYSEESVNKGHTYPQNFQVRSWGARSIVKDRSSDGQCEHEARQSAGGRAHKELAGQLV